MSTVACVGIAVRDLVFDVSRLPGREGKYYAEEFREVAGGVAANAAVAAARLGATARYVGRVGADSAGAAILDDLQAAGVDTSKVAVVPGVSSPVSAVLVDRKGERTIVNHTPAALFSDGDLAAAGDLDGVDAVLVDVRWPDGARRAVHAARTLGIPSVLDYDRAAPELGDELLIAASHVAFSHDALQATVGTSDPEAALASVASVTDAWLAVTMGGDGVYWLQDGS
ncbi:MAG: PfkB family carbohydrate kinase, partial [Acidimicrobiia bacterium]|nr:PfkB family carbohydrate kinase [Acidimicrobiia bacterium]